MSNSHIIIITGLPCTGKTTIGKKIAAKFTLPLIHKDGIKELLFDTLGWKDRTWSKKLSELTYHLMFHYAEILLQAHQTFILESNFRPKVHDLKFAELAQKYRFQTLQLRCSADGKLLFQRFKERFERGERHPGHVDPETFDELRPQLEQGQDKPLALTSHILDIDTTNFQQVDYQAIFREIEKFLYSDHKKKSY